LVLAKDFSDDSSEKAIQRRREQYRQVRAHVQKEDGRLQAYGWSLPGASTKTPGQQAKHAGGVPVPVPVYCRPLAEASPHMKVRLSLYDSCFQIYFESIFFLMY
jgi:c-Jun-amino-terminal kinase-interacting protein 4